MGKNTTRSLRGSRCIRSARQKVLNGVIYSKMRHGGLVGLQKKVGVNVRSKRLGLSNDWARDGDETIWRWAE